MYIDALWSMKLYGVSSVWSMMLVIEYYIRLQFNASFIIQIVKCLFVFTQCGLLCFHYHSNHYFVVSKVTSGCSFEDSATDYISPSDPKAQAPWPYYWSAAGFAVPCSDPRDPSLAPRNTWQYWDSTLSQS